MENKFSTSQRRVHRTGRRILSIFFHRILYCQIIVHCLLNKKKLAVTLYYFKDTDSLGMTASAFGIAINTASVIIGDVCKENLGPKYIYMPQDCDEIRRKVSEFEAKFGMIQAMGCIDGTHVPIKKPHKN